mmetsp:Transcript_128088/g.292718  ORF Transcript_128088/g.292718 Transcript_128088/m.292718 type:complete len:286 (+) Transcript_128088:44-901(+)
MVNIRNNCWAPCGSAKRFRFHPTSNLRTLGNTCAGQPPRTAGVKPAPCKCSELNLSHPPSTDNSNGNRSGASQSFVLARSTMECRHGGLVPISSRKPSQPTSASLHSTDCSPVHCFRSQRNAPPPSDAASDTGSPPSVSFARLGGDRPARAASPVAANPHLSIASSPSCWHRCSKRPRAPRPRTSCKTELPWMCNVDKLGNCAPHNASKESTLNPVCDMCSTLISADTKQLIRVRMLAGSARRAVPQPSILTPLTLGYGPRLANSARPTLSNGVCGQPNCVNLYS